MTKIPKGYRVLRHDRGYLCPKCKKPSYCKDCDVCEECGFVVVTEN